MISAGVVVGLHPRSRAHSDSKASRPPTGRYGATASAAATLAAGEPVVQTELQSWRAGDTSHDLTQARAFVSLAGGRNTEVAYVRGGAAASQPRRADRSRRWYQELQRRDRHAHGTGTTR